MEKEIKTKQRFYQRGQGMAEYVVVLVFGVMVMTVGPGGDVLLDLLGVMNDKYQGYSYVSSMSTLPDHDNLADYLIDEDIIDPIDPGDLVTALEEYTSFPDLDVPDLDMAEDYLIDEITSEVTSFF